VDIQIRLVAKNDIKEISSLIFESALFLKDIDFYDNGWNDFINSTNEEGLLKQYLDKDNIYYCAVLNSVIVGVICLRKLFRINQLFVSSKYQGKKIGTKLVKEVLKDRSNSEVMKVNSSSYAVKFYESCGFRVIGDHVSSNGFKFYPMEME
jgi:N-acetylglutamate synthase-like GNAT family acetyltransferase